MRNGTTRKDVLKADRQEALREYLQGRGHDQQAIELINKLVDLETDLDSTKVQRLNIAINSHFKFLNKYLPDLKAVEVSGGLSIAEMTDEQLNAELTREFTESTS